MEPTTINETEQLTADEAMEIAIGWMAAQVEARILLCATFGRAIASLADEVERYADYGGPIYATAASMRATLAEVESKSPSGPRSGYVYAVQAGYYCKIGRTKNTKVRLSQISTASALPISTVCVVSSDDCIALEHKLHEQFAGQRVRGEWYRLTQSDLSELKNVMLNHGKSQLA